jgi:WD40 repeat protein
MPTLPLRTWPGSWALLLAGVAFVPAGASEALPPHAVAGLGTGYNPEDEGWGGPIAFAPDARLVVQADGAKLRARDLTTDRVLRRLTTPRPVVRSLAVAPGGKLIATAERGVDLWDLSTGKRLASFGDTDEYITALAFSPDGKVLAGAGFEKEVRLWDVPRGKELRTLAHPHNVSCLAFSPDGKALAAGCWDDTITVWDVAAGKPRAVCRGHDERPLCVAFLPGGREVVSGGWGKTVQVWDARTGKLLRTLKGHGESVTLVAPAPDGKGVASAGDDNTVRLWDVRVGRERGRLEMDAPTRALAFAPGGKHLAVGSAGGWVDLLPTAAGGPSYVAGRNTPLVALAFSARGDTLTTAGGEGILRRWDVARARERSAVRVGGRLLGLSPRGSVAARRGAPPSPPVRLHDARTGKELRRLLAPAVPVEKVALSPDGAAVAMVSAGDRCVQQWDVATGRQKPLIKGPEGWGRWGPWVLNGTPDADLRRYLEQQGMVGELHALTFSPDGRLLAGGWTVTFRVWRADTGAELKRFAPERGAGKGQGGVRLAFSADGRTLATADRDGTVALWEVATGRLRDSFRLGPAGIRRRRVTLESCLRGGAPSEPEREWVRDLCFCPDGRSLALAGGASTASTCGTWPAGAPPPRCAATRGR